MASPVSAPAITAWPPLAGAAAAVAPALLDWASRDDDAAPRLCLITGGAGAGKSHLLAWLLVGSPSDPRTVIHGTVPAGGQIAETVAWELGHQLGYGPLSPEDLVDRVAADPRPVRLLLPDVHRAGRGPTDLPQARPHDMVKRLVAPLTALPHVRAAVEVGELDLLPTDQALVIDLGPIAFDREALGVPEPRPVDDPFGTRTAPAGATAGSEPLVETTGVADWRTAGRIAREQALDRAFADGKASDLLKDPGFLVHGSVAAITAALADSRVAVPSRLRTVWRHAAPALSTPAVADPERAAILHTAALGADPRLAEFLRPLAEAHRWSSTWFKPSLRPSAAALLPAPGSAPAGERLVTVDHIGRAEVRSVHDGSRLARVIVDPRQRPVGLAAAAEDCLLALDGEGMLHPLMVGAAQTVPAGADFLALYHNGITVLSASNRPTAVGCDGNRIVVADAEGNVHLWSSASPQSGPRSSRLHNTGITAVDCVLLREIGAVLLVSAGLDGTVRLWDSATGGAMPVPVERRTAAVPTALSLADTPAGLVLAVAWSDRRLHVWQVFEARMRPVPLLHTADALALAADGTVIAAGGQGTTALRLDLDTFWD